MAHSEQHFEEVRKAIKELESKGYRVINLELKSPDCIAIKDNKVYAVEILGLNTLTGKGIPDKYTVKDKVATYHMFDDVIIRTFLRKKNNWKYK